MGVGVCDSPHPRLGCGYLYRTNSPLPGLKNQHVASIQWLAEATDAATEGLTVGSKTLTFVPRRPPTELLQRHFRISAASGTASALLIFQAILPFLLFAGNDSPEPIVLDISGGTNVSFSLSFEYLDQVLLPTLEERFGILVERKLKRRAWSLGQRGRGEISLKIHPLMAGKMLQFQWPERYSHPSSYEVKSVDVSIITYGSPQAELQGLLVENLGELFPDADVLFKIVEDSGSEARWYILLVATSTAGIRWGRDTLLSMPKKTKKSKPHSVFAEQVARQVCRDLYEEVSVGGQVDEHLQDQLVVFQALSSGYSSLPRGALLDEASAVGPVVDALGKMEIDEGAMRKEKTHAPFGHGSMHTQTVRWVASELLPQAKFFNKGDIVEGAGFAVK